MYCIECGAQIPENSKFCSHCGKKQTEGEPSVKEKIAEKIIENEIAKQIVKAHKSSFDYQFLKKTVGYYLAWILLHLGLLLIGSGGIFSRSNMGAENFWPFGEYSDFDEVDYYDITKFLVYVIFPFAILIIISLIKGQQQPKQEEVIEE